MKNILIFLFVAFCFSVQGQKIVVDYITIMDESQQWPLTWDISMDSDSTLYTGNEVGRLYMKKLNEDWEELDVPDEDDSDIRKIEKDVNGNLWVATNGSGIFRLSEGEWTNYTTENSNISSNEFRYLETTVDGKVYAAGGEGINIFSNGAWIILNTNNSTLDGDDVDAMTYNPNTNRVLVGDNEYFYSINGFSIVNKINLDDEFGWMTWVTSLYAHEDLVYIGTESGLYLFENNQITDLTSIFNDKNVSDITVDKDGNLWLGEVFFGLHVYDGNTLHSIGSSDTLPSQVFDMMTFGDHVLTVGNRGARLAASHFEKNDVGVSDNPLSELLVYPTIVDQYLTFEDVNDIDARLEYLIYNNKGQLLKEFPFQKVINLEDLDQGIYYIVLRNQAGHQLYRPTKIIKK